MGTRGIVKFYEDGSELVSIYHQFDSYPSGVGMELATFLASGKLVNGLPFGHTERLFNGMGDQAAQYIAEFKTESGGMYIMPPGEHDHGQEYVYRVYGYFERNPLAITVEDYHNKVIFKGNLKDFTAFCKKEE